MKVIFKVLTGSRLYGLDLPTSDYDIKAIALPSKEDLLGMEDTAREHWDDVSIDPPGDVVVYSITKFLKLFMTGNPTVTELIFVDPQFYLMPSSSVWMDMVAFCKNRLISDKAISSYRGYLYDQYNRVKSRKAQNNREWMIEKYGFDIKCASHVFRLANQGAELIVHGTCHPTMIGFTRDVCMSIKKGEKTYDETINLLDIALQHFEKSIVLSKLPPFEKESMERYVNDFVFNIHYRVVMGAL
jgi:predicted nucleotidyltransferase